MCFVHFFFFFFKQKTAYEMRISDWSSDVCSSDLALPAENPLGDAVADIDAVGVERHLAGPLQRLQALDRSGHFHAVVGGKRRATGEFKQIGRASCRERVCQYV